jgi:MoaA/NifB/PqqE/SkfB family radical SAM enzyme
VRGRRIQTSGLSPTERDAASALAALFAPPARRVTLMLTTRCSLSCRYCYQRRETPRSMTPAILDAALDLVLRRPGPAGRVGLYGGEPLLEGEMVRHVVGRVAASAPEGLRPSVRLYTNGLLLDAETTDFLADHDVRLSISIDGTDEAQDDRSPGSFRVLDGFLDRLARSRPGYLRARVEARLTLTSRNVDHLSRSVLHLAGRGVSNIVVSPVLGKGRDWDDRAARELDLQLARLARELSPPAASGKPPAFLAFAPDPPRRDGPACGLGRPDSFFVDVDGTVPACAFFASSTLGPAPSLVREVLAAAPAPRVGDPGLSAAVAARGEALGALPLLNGLPRRRSPRGPCASCEALGECLVCPASIAFAPEQDPLLVPAIQCDWNRLVAKHRREYLARRAAGECLPQRGGSSSSAAATSAVTPARIEGA